MDGQATGSQQLPPRRLGLADDDLLPSLGAGLDAFRAQPEKRHERIPMPGTQLAPGHFDNAVRGDDVGPTEVAVGVQTMDTGGECTRPSQPGGHHGGGTTPPGVLLRPLKPGKALSLHLGQEFRPALAHCPKMPLRFRSPLECSRDSRGRGA